MVLLATCCGLLVLALLPDFRQIIIEVYDRLTRCQSLAYSLHVSICVSAHNHVRYNPGILAKVAWDNYRVYFPKSLYAMNIKQISVRHFSDFVWGRTFRFFRVFWPIAANIPSSAAPLQDHIMELIQQQLGLQSQTVTITLMQSAVSIARRFVEEMYIHSNAVRSFVCPFVKLNTTVWLLLAGCFILASVMIGLSLSAYVLGCANIKG